jgi:signal transduction histidine kinase
VKRWLSSLTNRIFLSSALLAVLVLAVAIYVVNVMVTAQAERDLQRGLEEAGAWVEQYRGMLASNLAQQAMLIADLPKFKAAVYEDHAPTVRQSAMDYRRQIAADLFVVTNARGEVLAAEGDVPVDLLQRLRAGGGKNDATPLLWPRGDALLQVVVVPIWIDPAAPEVLGRLAVGVALDTALAERIKALTDADVAFLDKEAVLASTLPATASKALIDLRQSRAGAVQVAGEQYVAQVRTLPSDAQTGPALIILRSRSAHQRLLRTLHTALAGTGAVAILLATLLSYAVALTITRPLGAITAAVREMAATGDLTRRFRMPPDVRLLDEDASVLVSTLDTMTTSIARFQKEVAQRERLSSLGRLSTVIAHEIRNPLMIIKTALRSLRSQDLPPDRMRQAVTDIDEEVDRLNRLVNGVLDFAKPMRFDLAPASLSTICRGAAAAAFVDGESVACQLTLDNQADEVVTDAERLRQALLNLLVNARDAVLGQRALEPALARRDASNVLAFQPDPQMGAGGNGAAVQLATCAVNADRVHIIVRDSGGGIDVDHLPRIFEPYFTTRRTGSGLGLAITRNIVEGLGGTINLESEPGLGTEIRIDLPRMPRGSGGQTTT